MRTIRLIVIVVVVEVLPPVAEAVPCSTGREVLNIGIDRSDELVRSGSGFTKRPVDGVGGNLPDQRVQGFAELPIRIEAVDQAFHVGFTLAQVRVDSCAVFGSVPIDGAVQQIDTDQGRREVVIPCIELGAFFRGEKPIVAEDVATDNYIPLAELLAVQETEVGLLGPHVPGFGMC